MTASLNVYSSDEWSHSVNMRPCCLIKDKTQSMREKTAEVGMFFFPQTAAAVGS